MADRNEFAERTSALEQNLNDLRAEVASHRPVGDLIKYLLYFWAAISLLLGAFGWKQFSDLEEMVGRQVKLQLPSDKAKYAEYSRLIEDTRGLHSDFLKLTAEYRKRVDELKYAKVLSKDFDIEGRLLTVMSEARLRSQNPGSDKLGGSDQYADTLLEPRWRTRAIAVIADFKNSMEQRSAPADFIFNVAQLCRMLQQFQLARDLTRAAYERDSSPPIKAMALSSTVATSTDRAREVAFRDLLQMVRRLGPNSPEIVLAEAWNAAEDRRRYPELMAALDDLIRERSGKDGVLLPSYVYAIKAQALLRDSRDGSLTKAQATAKEGWERLSQESPLASWYEGSVRELKQVMELLHTAEGLPKFEEVARPRNAASDFEEQLLELLRNAQDMEEGQP